MVGDFNDSLVHVCASVTSRSSRNNPRPLVIPRIHLRASLSTLTVIKVQLPFLSHPFSSFTLCLRASFHLQRFRFSPAAVSVSLLDRLEPHVNSVLVEYSVRSSITARTLQRIKILDGRIVEREKLERESSVPFTLDDVFYARFVAPVRVY